MNQVAEQPVLDEQTIEEFDKAQRQTISLMRELVSGLQSGQTPSDISKSALSAAPNHGFNGWFHAPHVRFGWPKTPPKTLGQGALQPGTLVEIDLAPSNDRAFGDFGYAFIFESNEEPQLLSQARELCRAACGFSNRFKCTGEIYVFAQAWAVNRSLSLGDTSAVGHRCFPPSGRMAWGWPKLARAAILMRRNQIQWFNHRRMEGLYAVQPRLVSDQQGIAFEEMILVEDHGHRIMGRESIDEVGTI